MAPTRLESSTRYPAAMSDGWYENHAKPTKPRVRFCGTQRRKHERTKSNIHPQGSETPLWRGFLRQSAVAHPTRRSAHRHHRQAQRRVFLTRQYFPAHPTQSMRPCEGCSHTVGAEKAECLEETREGHQRNVLVLSYY